jgi:N-acetylglutamate synthase/N-acetylornithine aminotransferase
MREHPIKNRKSKIVNLKSNMNPTLPKGFRAAGIAAGIKKNGKADLALISSETDCVAAAVFTTNKMKAAPVIHDQKLIADGRKPRNWCPRS